MGWTSQLLSRRHAAVPSDPEQASKAESYLKWLSHECTVEHMKELRETAMRDGLEVTNFEGSLISTGQRRKALELLEKFENKKRWATEVLRTYLEANDQDEEA